MVIAITVAANTATIRAGRAAAKGSGHDTLSVPSAGDGGRLCMVGRACPAGRCAEWLWPGRLASVLAVSLGRGKVNERHLIGVIRCQRLGRVPRPAADVLRGLTQSCFRTRVVMVTRHSMVGIFLVWK
jgi:hypothetical protein